MPNIEIHGVTNSSRVEQIRQQIRDVLTLAYYEDEVVITDMRNVVRNLKGDSQPFLRIIVTKGAEKELEDIKQRFIPLSMEIETLIINEFIMVEGKSK